MFMEAIVMFSKHIKVIINSQRMTKGIILVSLLVLISMVATACNRAGNQSAGYNNIMDNATGLTPSKDPEPTKVPTLIQEQEPTEKPTPTNKPVSSSELAPISDLPPSKKVHHSTTAFAYSKYLFYKTGKLTNTMIIAENLETSEVTEITTIEDTYFNSSEFYLKDSDIYYHGDGNIYRVGVDGKNKTRLYKGKATILGFHEDDLFALDRVTREIIRIGKTGEKKSLVKMDSIDSLEAVMVRDGIYFINKQTNNIVDGNDPLDRLYYISLDGKDKREVYSALDIFDLKMLEDEVFFLAISDAPETMEIIKAKGSKATTIYNSSKDELEALGFNWIYSNFFTLLGVNKTHVYYGLDFNNGKEMNIYSVETSGKNHGLYRNAYDIKGMYPGAYFRRGNVDNGYLNIVFDCDEAPVEVYLINLKDDSTIKFEGGYYLSGSIDVEGDFVYYLKSSDYDHYAESPELYQYERSMLTELK